MEMKNFEEQLDEIRVPCIIDFFKDKNLLNFLKMHINMAHLLENYNNKTTNCIEKKTLCEKLIEMENLTENVIVKELINTIKMQIYNKEIYNKEICNKNTICNKLPNIKLENILLDKLNKIFPTSDIEITITELFNIFKLKENNKPDIYIYSQILDIKISLEIVEEFYKLSKEQNNCAILCNRNYGIYNKNSFEIDILDNNNINIFIPNYNDNYPFNLAVKIIYHMYDNIKDNIGCIELDKDLFQRLKLEYSYFLTMHNKYLNSMKSNIISLEKLQLIQLDHFFKRTHINSDDKPYNCQLCGTKFGTDKSLKSHLKIKHQIQLGKTRNKKVKEDEPEEPEEVNGLITFD